jgi:RimJ/RimL family protein N-acetyltransferase
VKPFSLKTERLRLTPLNLRQLERIREREAIEAVLGVPAADDLLTPPVLKALEIKISRMSNLSESAHRWLTYWLLVLAPDPTGIGLAGFKGVPDVDGQVEIGYGIASACEGRGYTTEAVSALVDWAFLQPGCRVIIAETRRDNPASQRVLQKTGFQIADEDQELLCWERIKPETISKRHGMPGSA